MVILSSIREPIVLETEKLPKSIVNLNACLSYINCDYFLHYLITSGNLIFLINEKNNNETLDLVALVLV